MKMVWLSLRSSVNCASRMYKTPAQSVAKVLSKCIYALQQLGLVVTHLRNATRKTGFKPPRNSSSTTVSTS